MKQYRSTLFTTDDIYAYPAINDGGKHHKFLINVPIFHLFKGRHEMPFNAAPAIFGETTDVMDFDTFRLKARDALNGCAGEIVVVYVTGLTPALVEVINVAHEMGIPLCLMHWDRDVLAYKRQWVD